MAERRWSSDAIAAGRIRIDRLLHRLGLSWVLILGFALIVLVGTLLLRLPAAAAAPGALGWSDALFTSTSAVTVTGLTVVGTATDLSLLGQLIVLALMQVGGVGFIAFSVLLFQLVGRRVTLQERFAVQQVMGASHVSGVLGLARMVLLFTVAVELLGAALLFVRWQGTMPAGTAAYRALFHAVSAYCNAGFDLFAGTGQPAFFGYGGDGYTLGVVGLLIVLGGLGIPVVYDLWSYRRDRQLSLHTKLTLVFLVVLNVVGVLFVATDGQLVAALTGYLPAEDALPAGVFTAVSARTAGLTVLSLAELGEGTQLVLLIWMFIGGAPASMAGGVTTSTVAVILVAVYATTRGDNRAAVFGRSLPRETINKAIAVMTVSTLVVVGVTLALVHLGDPDIYPVAFEVVSAFSNTGYSLGHTANLTTGGRLLMVLTMFWGRLGPLTVVIALAQRAHPSLVGYPEEPVIMG